MSLNHVALSIIKQLQLLKKFCGFQYLSAQSHNNNGIFKTKNEKQHLIILQLSVLKYAIYLPKTKIVIGQFKCERKFSTNILLVERITAHCTSN